MFGGCKPFRTDRSRYSLVAALNADDDHHLRMRTAAGHRRRLLRIPSPVLTEVCYPIEREQGPATTGRDRTLTLATAWRVGAMLLAENARSVTHRYDEADWEPV